MNRTSIRATITGVAFLATAAVFAGEVTTTESEWSLGGDGSWATASNWAPEEVPDNTGDTVYDVTIMTKAGVSVSVTGSRDVDHIDVGPNDMIVIENGNRLMIDAARGDGVINNQGVIMVNSAGGHTYFQPMGGDCVLMGGGEIVLSDGPNNWLYRFDAVGAWTNMDNTIRGGGNFGWSGAPTDVTNHGAIVADVTNPLICIFNEAVNDGEMYAEDGGTLTLQGGVYDNTGGSIIARDGSFVDCNATTISGGIVGSEGSGIFRANSAASVLQDVTTQGLLSVLNGQRFHAVGTITNNGTIEINSTGSHTYIQPTGGDTMLIGGGEIIMSDQENNWIYQVDGKSTITNVDNTIRGSGHIGWTGFPTDFTNQGTMIADGPNQPFYIDPGTGSTFLNEGLLHLEGGNVSSSSGTIQNAGQVVIDNERIFDRNGHYNQTAGSTIVNGELEANEVILDGGELGGNGLIDADLINAAGSVNAGESAGLLTVEHDYQQDDGGSLVAQLGGLDPGTGHDQVVINGIASLAGTLKIELLKGYEPNVGDQFTILTAADINGEFFCSDYEIPAAGEFIVTYSDTEVVVHVVGDAKDFPIQDINKDGVVDVIDLLILLGSWGECESADCCPGDMNLDGFVDTVDLLDLLGSWG